MRFPAIPIIFLLLILLSVGVVVPNLAPLLPDRIDLAKLLSNRVDMRVRLDGDIRVRFLPRPQIIFNDVQIMSEAAQTDGLVAAIPVLVIDLDGTDFLQRKISLNRVSVRDAQIDVRLAQGSTQLLGALLGQQQIGWQFSDSRVSVTGLNTLSPADRVVLPRLSLLMAPRDDGDPLILRFTHPLGNDSDAQFRLRLSERGNDTLEVSAELAMGSNERLAFEGFVSRRARWRMDGELALSSANMLAATLEHYTPLEIVPEARRIEFSGLVRGDRTGLRSENLEVSALNTLFQSRLAFDWPQKIGDAPLLTGRMSTGSINLEGLAMRQASGSSRAAPPLPSDLWEAFFPDLALGMRIEANQFEFDDETGSNLLLSFDWRDGRVDIDRMSLNLPFRSALLYTGVFDLRADNPHFVGSFSTRSSDMLAASIWLGDKLESDVSGFVEAVDETRFQRVSLAGDIEWSNAALTLSNLIGRLGDDRLEGAVTVQRVEGPQMDVALSFSRFDMADWGITDARTANTASVWQPLNQFIAARLRDENKDRSIRLDVSAQQFYSGTEAFGSAKLQAQLNDRSLTITALDLPDFSGSALSAAGVLHYDASPLYGKLSIKLDSPAIGRFAQAFPLNGDLPVAMQAEVLLTAPDAPDWPRVKLFSAGHVGALEAQLDISTPSRTLDYAVSGSTLNARLKGAANDLADAFSLPTAYSPAANGQMQFDLAAQSNNVSTVNGQLRLAGDQMDIAGTLRPSADGGLMEGSLTVQLADFLRQIDETTQAQTVPASVRMQINASRSNIGFSNLEGQIGDGQVTGEGLVQLQDDTPRFNASIALDGMDASWLLPQFGENGWSQATMAWAWLGRTDAEIDLRAVNLGVGRVPVSALTAQLKVTDGVLEAPEITAQLWRGSLTANLQAEGGSLTPYFNLETTFAGVQLDDMMDSLYGAKSIAAPIDGVLNLRGRGASAAAMMVSLDGNAQFEIGEGAFILDTAPPAKFERALGVMKLQQGRIDDARTDFVFAPPQQDGNFQGQVNFVSRQVGGQLRLYPARIWDISGDLTNPQVARKPLPTPTPAPPTP